MQIEFQRTPDQIDISIINKTDGTMSVLTEKSHEIIDPIISIIKRDYSEAYESLYNIYGKAAHYKYYMVRRFIKCNMSIGDAITDFDGNKFNFEDVVCPMRGECKWDGIICHPKFNTTLSDRELEIAKMICDDLSEEKIADRAFISIYTVINHKKNIYKKLGFHNRTQLVNYINENFTDK
jgi:DNA-binding CsgD family transcriptional regulator